MYDWSISNKCNSDSLDDVSVVVERMYDWSFLLTHETTTTKFQLLLKGCTIEAIWRILLSCAVRGFSCCWKDVRLKPEILVESLHVPLFQLLLKGCTIEAKDAQGNVKTTTRFSCCWKDVRLKRWQAKHLSCPCPCFSCCWKDVRLKLTTDWIQPLSILCSFSCCWKDVRLKRLVSNSFSDANEFQLLLKGCTIEAPKPTDWKQMIFDSWFLICFSKMVDLHKKCHYFRKFGVIRVIAWLFLIVVVTSSYILSTTKSP